jgi:hypothetical protein
MRVFRTVRPSLGALVALAVAGCSSGGASSLPRVVPPGSVPHGAAHAPASFLVKVPQGGSVSVQSTRRTRYVSPATQSIQITVNPGPSQQSIEADLTPSNPNCSVPQAVSYLTCSVPLALAAGTYSANFVTYDKTGGASGGGSRLSETDGVAFTISASGGDQIGVTLGGVPASLSVAAAPASTGRILQPAGFAQLGITGVRRQSLSVNALDADGDVIVGPGSAALSVTSSDPTVVAVTQPTAQQPSTVGVQVKKFASAPITLSFTATPPAASNARPVTLALTTQTLPELFVTDTSSNVRAYADVRGVAVPVPGDDITVRGVQSPNVNLAVADPNGNVWAYDASNGFAKVYVPGTASPIAADKLLFGNDFIGGLAFDPAGTLYVFDQATQTISAYTPGSATANFTFSTGFQGLEGLAFDPRRGVVWLGTGTAAIGYDVQQRVHLGADTIPNLGAVTAIAVDAADDVWLCDLTSPSIEAFSKQNGAWSQIATDTIYLSTRNGAGALAIDPFGLIWTSVTPQLGGTALLQSFQPGQNAPLANTSEPRIGEALSITVVP